MARTTERPDGETAPTFGDFPEDQLLLEWARSWVPRYCDMTRDEQAAFINSRAGHALENALYAVVGAGLTADDRPHEVDA